MLSGGGYQRSTEEVGAAQRFDYWRDAICDAYVPLDPQPQAPSDSFAGRIDGVCFSDLHASQISADAHRVRLGRGGIARQHGNPFFANLLLAGRAQVRQGDRQGVALPGDVYLVDCSEPWEVHFPERFSMFCIEIDEALLRPRLGRSGRLDALVISGRDGAGRVLSRYMELLRCLPAQDLSAMQTLMTTHCSDLLSRAHAGQGSEAVPGRIRQDLIRRLQAFVERNLHEPGLSAEAACRSLHVSRSYLFKVLADAGSSFAALVRERRLQAARQALRETPQRPVSAVGADWGFGSAAAFHRAYKARFGETPQQTRVPSSPGSLAGRDVQTLPSRPPDGRAALGAPDSHDD